MNKFILVLLGFVSNIATAQTLVETVAGPRATGYLGIGSNPVYTDDSYVIEDLPEAFDWRDQPGIVTPVRNQGQCGSCVSFALAKSFEGAAAHQIGIVGMNTAEQEILSCRRGDAFGCNGAYMTAAGYVVSKGLAAEESFPYVARAVRCKQVESIGKADSYKLLGARNRKPTKEEIKSALITYGPMFVTVRAGGSGWSGRTGKVTTCRRTSATNHAVTLIGYNKDGWIFRNSWGANWGAKGDSLIGYGCDGFADEAGYFVVK
jgi:C1A family cysteine protease